jgi:hypothetical protein
MNEWPTGLRGLRNRRAGASQLGLVAAIRRASYQSRGVTPAPDDLDHWDSAANTTNYLLCSGTTVVGAVRTTVHDGRGASDESTVYQDFAAEIRLHVAGERYLEVDRLCVVRNVDSPDSRLVLALLQNVTADLDAHDCAYVVAAATAAHEPFFVSMGFRPIPPPRSCAWSSEPATLLIADWRLVQETLRHHWLFHLMFSPRNRNSHGPVPGPGSS